MSSTDGIHRRALARLGLTVIALLLLAAHFWRAGEWWGVGLSLAGLVLLPIGQPWARRLLQALLLAGMLEWLWTGALIAQERVALGMPWGRMALILGAVACLTGAAALLLPDRRRGGQA